ncbi:hypothetical protein BZG36_00584 [Bifiguratus adelaidae]|uniref:Histidine kinase n=1 Tax=Bifiguratus adelaidae TaxID=1938954 RepID=A0A261Y7I4_9FUNG|nr:hypothetical protein BZG36_00584 [Bifiguratus adelaidae]
MSDHQDTERAAAERAPVHVIPPRPPTANMQSSPSPTTAHTESSKGSIDAVVSLSEEAAASRGMETNWGIGCEQFLANYAQGSFDPKTIPPQPSTSDYPVPDYLASPSTTSDEGDGQSDTRFALHLADPRAKQSLEQGSVCSTPTSTWTSPTSNRLNTESTVMTDFLAPPMPHNEKARREALYQYRILYTEPDVNFDRIVNMTAKLFGVRTCLISLVHSDEQWVKAEVGFGKSGTKRSISFCGHAVLNQSGEPLIILDASKDWRFAKNPLVTGEPYIRFYVGAPLYNKDGLAIGTLCIIDPEPREEFTTREQDLLTELAATTMHEMELWAEGLRYRSLKRLQNNFSDFQKAYLQNSESLTSSNESREGSESDSVMPEKQIASPSNELAALISAPDTVMTGKDLSLNAALSVDFEKACRFLAQITPVPEVITPGPGPVEQFNFSPASMLTFSGMLSLFDSRLQTFHERENERASSGFVQNLSTQLPEMSHAHSAHSRERYVASSASLGKMIPLLSILAGHTVRKALSSDNPRNATSETLSSVSDVLKDSDILSALQSSAAVDEIIHGGATKLGKIFKSKLPFPQPAGLADPYRGAMIVPMIPIVPYNESVRDDKLQDTTLPTPTGCEASLGGKALPFGLIIVLSKDQFREFEPEELSFCYNLGITIVSQVMQRKVIVADRAKSAFISSISHELRTPLHGILGTVDLMANNEESSLDPEQGMFLDTIRSSTKLLASIVNNVLDLAKLEKGGHSRIRSEETVHLIDLMEEVGELVNLESGKPSVRFFLSVDYDVPEGEQGSDTPSAELLTPESPTNAFINRSWIVKADSECLKRVLLNLLNNAFKFTTEGYVHLSLSRPDLPPRTDNPAFTDQLLNESTSGPSKDYQSSKKTLYPFLFTIQDTGVGISKEYMTSTLFQSFSQQDPLRQGVGLGLRITSEFVRLMGGHIEVQSTGVPGEGSTFKVIVYCELADMAAVASMMMRAIPADADASVPRGNSLVRSIGSPLDYQASGKFLRRKVVNIIIADHLQRQVVRRFLCGWWGMDLIPESSMQSPCDVCVFGGPVEELTSAVNAVKTSNPETKILYLSPAHSKTAIAIIKHIRRHSISHIVMCTPPYGPRKLLNALNKLFDRMTGNRERSGSPVPCSSTQSTNTHTSVNATPPQKVDTDREKRLDDQTEARSREHSDSKDASSVMPSTEHDAADVQDTASKSIDQITNNIKTLNIDHGHEASAARHISQSESLPTSKIAKVVNRQKRVLIVEDNEVNRMILTKFLSRLGILYEEAADGSIGLEMFKATFKDRQPGDCYYDIVLMDINMPVMNGYEATLLMRQFEEEYIQQLTQEDGRVEHASPTRPSLCSARSNEGFSRCLIYALTGLAEDRDRQLAFKCGVDGFLTKPISLQVLANMLALTDSTEKPFQSAYED